MKVGFVCASNGLDPSSQANVIRMKEFLNSISVEVEEGKYLYKKKDVFSGNPKERAGDLNGFYDDEEMGYIFDLSGGDIANEVLPHLDYDLIRGGNVVYAGYSDLTTVINAIYSQTGKASMLYHLGNMNYEYGHIHKAYLRDLFLEGKDTIFHPPFRWIQGDQMTGTMVGGNIRCLLKLAGTKYFPDFTDKILFVEARSGKPAQLATYFAQLSQLGVFDMVKGIFLGNFIQMEREGCQPDVVSLLKEHISESMPLAKTDQVGHGTDSMAIWIGKSTIFTKDGIIRYQ